MGTRRLWVGMIVAGMAVSALRTTAGAVPTNDEIMRMLRQLQRQVAAQRVEIKDLREQLAARDSVAADEVSRVVRNEMDAALDAKIAAKGIAQIKDNGSLVTLRKNIDNLAIEGDARFRFERQVRQVGSGAAEEARDRFRTRLRIGAVWTDHIDGWKLGVGVATGGSGATSTNDTWSDGAVFETGDLRLDYAYADHAWENDGSAAHVIIGQQHNPFIHSALLWDSDVRPAGITARLEAGGPFLTIGAYDVYHLGRDETDAALIGVQAGLKTDVGDDGHLTVAAAYYHFTDAFTHTIRHDADGNGKADGTNLPTTLDPGYEFHVGDLYAKFNTKAGDVGLGFLGDVWKNFGAAGPAGSGQNGGTIDPDRADVGWVAGIEAKLGKAKIAYKYGHVEADSMVGGLKDSDFGETAGMTDTDVEGHKLGLSLGLTKNSSLGLAGLRLHQIDGSHRDGELYQVDFKYKF